MHLVSSIKVGKMLRASKRTASESICNLSARSIHRKVLYEGMHEAELILVAHISTAFHGRATYWFSLFWSSVLASHFPLVSFGIISWSDTVYHPNLPKFLSPFYSFSLLPTVYIYRWGQAFVLVSLNISPSSFESSQALCLNLFAFSIL